MGAEQPLSAYLDTHVVVHLYRGELKHITKQARQALDRYDLLISPIVLMELAYLRESRRVHASPESILDALFHSIDLRVCSIPFDRVARVAIGEAWTRDAFDRMIVAHAKANGEAPLISSDSLIAQHYPNTIW